MGNCQFLLRLRCLNARLAACITGTGEGHGSGSPWLTHGPPRASSGARQQVGNNYPDEVRTNNFGFYAGPALKPLCFILPACRLADAAFIGVPIPGLSAGLSRLLAAAPRADASRSSRIGAASRLSPCGLGISRCLSVQLTSASALDPHGRSYHFGSGSGALTRRVSDPAGLCNPCVKSFAPHFRIHAAAASVAPGTRWRTGPRVRIGAKIADFAQQNIEILLLRPKSIPAALRNG